MSRRHPSRSAPTGGSASSARGRGPAPVVEFADVAVVRDDVLMLDDASGSVAPGSVMALTGSNGSGKTTLLRAIAGMLVPTTGTITVAGRSPDDRDPQFRRSLAALIGPPATARDLIVDDHLRFIAATWGAGASAARSTAQDLLDALGIRALASRYPHELSSGQSQLVALALTLARPAEVLLLDEPEQRLDVDRISQVIEVLRARAESGTAIILASHNARMVEELADDVLHLTGAL